MHRGIILAAVYASLLLFAAADVVCHYPQLPEKMATHFDGAGRADGWSMKASFVSVQAGVLGATAGLIIGLAFLVPWLPASLNNLPHKDYWFASGRVEESRSYLREWLLGTGAILVTTLVALQHAMLRANLHPEPIIGHWPWVILGFCFSGIGGALVLLFRRFPRP